MISKRSGYRSWGKINELLYNVILVSYSTAKWFSHIYTYVHYFLDYFPIYVITKYGVEFPVLHSRFSFILYIAVYISEKTMAPHSSTLAWKIPWMEEPGRLQSMGSLRVEHVWANSLSLFTFRHWRRKWQPTPVFLPGESQGQGCLLGCRLWGRTESDTTEVT